MLYVTFLEILAQRSMTFRAESVYVNLVQLFCTIGDQGLREEIFCEYLVQYSLSRYLLHTCHGQYAVLGDGDIVGAKQKQFLLSRISQCTSSVM